MTRVRVSADYDAPPDEVWRILEPVESHIDWMADAESIRFVGEQTRGVGTAFDCVTRVGPIRLTDRMEIVEWEPERAMGVRHTGVVRGTGRFLLAPLDAGLRTRFTWDEELTFPWWLAGRIGAAVGGRTVMVRIWRRNLERLRPLVERRP
ncbi:MAG: SRPBCC family protein [Ilumatobacteraceae bacterium]